MQKFLKNLSNFTWYRQGAAVKLLYISYPYEACSHFTVRGKLISPYYFGYIGFFKNNFMYYHFTNQSAEIVGQFYLKKQIINSCFLQNFKKYWEKHYFQKVLVLSRNYDEVNFQKFSNSQLILNFQNFSKIYENTWRESIFLDAFDVFGEKAISYALQSSKIKLSGQELQIMTSTKESTWAQKEKKELLELMKINDKKTLEKELQIHAQKWHWLQNDYEHIKTLTPEHFKKELFGLKKQLLILKQEQQTLRHFWTDTKRRKKIEKKLKQQTKTLAILNGLAALASWRDTRKAISQMANATILNSQRKWPSDLT